MGMTGIMAITNELGDRFGIFLVRLPGVLGATDRALS